VQPLLERIAEVITRHRMMERGQRVGVAVSGGADSVCLLHALRELAPRWELRLSVLHLNHRLRGEESDGDAAFVCRLAADLGLECHAREIDVAARNRNNLEQTARQARQEFFLDLLRGDRLDRVATGHTRSDQAETVLFRLIRGTGITGLAGVRPATVDGLVRPLLEVSREETREYLRRGGIAWREDSTNRDLTLTRNRLRHQLLPELAREWNPAIEESLARLATLAQEEERYWDGQIHAPAVTGGAVVLKVEELVAAPVALARRLLRSAIGQIKGDLRQVDFEHVERALHLAMSPRGEGTVTLPGVVVERSFGWLRVGHANTVADYRIPLPVPGQIILPGTAVLLDVKLAENNDWSPKEVAPAGSRYNVNRSCLDWERLPAPLELRNWRPGDQYQPVGAAARVKLKTLFQRRRIPRWSRRGWPVVVAGEEIVWTRQFGAAMQWAALNSSRKVLTVKEFERFRDSSDPGSRF
jgi:tRNA(Ile)-lysidine synthase